MMDKRLLLSLLLFLASSAEALSGDSTRNISLACSATRYESLCRKFILASPEVEEAARLPVEFVKVSIKVALGEVNRSLLELEDVVSDRLVEKLVFEDARELLSESQALLSSCIDEDMRSNSSLDNVRHWLSAALTYVNDCGEFVRFHQRLLDVFEGTVIPLLSNTLWVTDAFASSPSNFSGWGNGSLPFPSRTQATRITKDLEEWNRFIASEESFEYDLGSASAVVSQNPDHGTHTTIQAAVDGAPEHLTRRYVIYIRAGVYDELVRIPTEKTMLAFIGDGINQTVITGNLSVAMNISTYRTATLIVGGNGFIARDLTVMNTAGPGSQAVAMRVDSDMSAFHRCSFWGFQDTLYTHAYRQFYRDCSIYGSIDFIFGNAASIFQNCNIQIRSVGSNKTSSTSTITAQGRTDPAQQSAFVCQSCWILGTPEYMQALATDSRRHVAYLGRPWKEYAQSIFIESYLDMIIDSAGWMPWNGTENLDTSILGEYRNFGPGFTPESRVSWSRQLNPLSAYEFSVRGLIQGGFWLPFTGVPFRPLF